MHDPAGFELRSATVSYDGRAALAGLNLSIGPGELVALVGPSGAGKTTLLRLLNAANRPTAGAVLVDGIDLDRAPSATLRTIRSQIGFVYQDLALVPNLRVIQNVVAGKLGRRSFFPGIRSLLWPRSSDVNQAYAILERVGIGEKLYQRTDQLSGGQRQRVAIARALFQEPRALLADEPVSSVDPARARDTVSLLTSIAAERGVTLVVSLHDLGLAREFFPRLVGLRNGRMLFDAPSRSVTDADLHALYALAELEEVA